MKRTLVCVFASFTMLFCGCGGPANQGPAGSGSGGGKTKITIKGSDTMVILGQRWAEAFMKANSNATIQVTGGGSGTGIAALINGSTDICASSRPMKDKEKADAKEKHKKDVVETAVALDGLAIFLHEKNPLTEMSIPQVESIYLGKTTDWKDLNANSGKIVCYSRENNSGTYEYFKEHVLKKADFAADVQTLPGTAAVINAVSKDPNSIGYGGIGYAKGVKAMPVKATDKDKAVPPTLDTVVSGEYPISRKLYFYTLGEPSGEIKNFIQYALSDEGQKICDQVGYYPLKKK